MSIKTGERYYDILPAKPFLKDWRGHNIIPGCIITYPCRQGSSLWVQEAVVEDVVVEQIYDWSAETHTVVYVQGTGRGSYLAHQRRVKITTLSRITVME